MTELWAMQSTFSMLSLLGSFSSGEVAPESVLSLGQIELFDI